MKNTDRDKISHRLFRFVHELRLSGIGPSKWLFATFLRVQEDQIDSSDP